MIFTDAMFPVITNGSTLVAGGGSIAMAASPELAAEIAAMMNACHMLRSVALPEIINEPEPDPLPAEETPPDEPGWTAPKHR